METSNRFQLLENTPEQDEIITSDTTLNKEQEKSTKKTTAKTEAENKKKSLMPTDEREMKAKN